MTTGARLRAFVAVSDAGSIRAAAQRLYVTESSVSSAVTALARDVGVSLVERRGRSIQITPAGVVFSDYARTILGLHAEGVAAARGEIDPAAGQLRLAAAATAAEHVLPAALAALRSQCPELTVTVNVVTREHVWPLLARHQVDVVIAGRPPSHQTSCIRAVRANDLVVVAAPAVAAGFSLERTAWLLREHGSGTRETCEALLVSADAHPPQLTLGSNGAVIACARAGLGATLVSRDAVHADLRDGTLAQIPVPGTPLHRPWHVVTQDRMTPQAGLFVSQLLLSGAWSKPARAC